MSVKRKEKSIFKTVCIDVGSMILILLLLLIAATCMINTGLLATSVSYIVVAAMVFTACIASAVILKMQQGGLVINAIGTGIILVLTLLMYFAQQVSGAQAPALARCAVCIVAGRFIPNVINVRKNHKTKRRSRH